MQKKKRIIKTNNSQFSHSGRRVFELKLTACYLIVIVFVSFYFLTLFWTISHIFTSALRSIIYNIIYIIIIIIVEASLQSFFNVYNRPTAILFTLFTVYNNSIFCFTPLQLATLDYFYFYLWITSYTWSYSGKKEKFNSMKGNK